MQCYWQGFVLYLLPLKKRLSSYIFLYLLNIRKLKIVKLLTHENHNITDSFPARLRQSAG